MRRFYFTSESHCDGDNPANDHCGNIRGARTIAQKLANELNETVYINDSETNDIVDCIEPDSILDEISEPVENKNSLTFDELIILRVLVEDRISHNEEFISFLNSSLLSSVEKSESISSCEKQIDSDKLIVKKLRSLSLEAYYYEKT